MQRLLLVFFWLALLGTAGVHAKPLAQADVPEPLKPWIDWALHGGENRVCPFLYNNAEIRRCAWPTRLELSLEEKAGGFGGFWQVDAESWVVLPGAAGHWPQQVELDGKPALVVARDDAPAILLPPGAHKVSGRFAWDRLPENLTVPRDSGLIALTVNGKSVAMPVFNEQGQLWIQGAQRPVQEEIANTLVLRVFRRIADDIPLRVSTRLDLEVAGEQREVLLEGGLLPEFIPLAVSAPLPARLEPDGRLRVQLRPGRWQIELSARHPGETLRLQSPENVREPWPVEEIWSFEANSAVRVVEIEGAPAVEPRQTDVPDEWQGLPAYRLRPGEALSFKPLRRGDPESEPDSLTLRRSIWLDFDGGGYTFHDEIGGRMSRNWRLDALPGVRLGRAAIDGAPQLITLLDDSGRAGVEVRRGQVRFEADSRSEGGVSTLPATGWARDFQQVAGELNLPPGWRLFAVTGVDNAPDSWVGRWTLLDLFLVLIAALAVARLRGWPQAGLALVALVLLWHEPDAPRYVWLHLLAAVALLKALPTGRVAAAAKTYRNLAALALALIAIPFMVEQVRLGLYPQLELPWFSPVNLRQALVAKMEAPAEAPAMEGDAMMQGAPAPASPELKRAPMRKSWPEPAGGAAKFSETDPEALTQTGPGLPEWRWKPLSLSWNGPVLSNQKVGLILLSPGVNLLLNLLRVGLLLALAFVLLADGSWRGGAPAVRETRPPLLLIVLAALFIPAAKADFPGQILLDELKTRLLAAPECLPECVQISLMRLRLGADEMRQQLEIHAQEPLAMPLPAQAGQWLPSRVSVDGVPADGLFRSPEGALWLSLKPGRHEVVLTGALPSRGQVQLALPLRPRRVEIEGGGWRVEGLRENAEPEAQLQLSRTIEKGEGEPAAPELEARPLPPFLAVERTLSFGLNWRVSTRVRRVSPADAPVVVEIPLLEGESVTSQGLQVKNGKVAVSMVPGQTDLGWESALEKRPTVLLKAHETTVWTEIWRADVSPVWHLGSEGIAVVRHQDSGGNWLPEWRPWPGETVKLDLVRPRGAPGNTLTIESSRLRLSPGLRATDASLTLAIRSSQGGQHNVKLPEGADLLAATVDGVSQPIRQQGRVVTLPIRPGEQSLMLAWRESLGLGGRFMSPEVELGTASVNSFISFDLGRDRWVLLTGGPRLGPAVLFWGVLAVIVVLAAALGRIRWTPLKARQWALLLIGLSQIPVAGGLCVVGWLLALGWRARVGEKLDDSRFNGLQLGLALLSLLALTFLFYAVQQGLLGLPDMQVAGNNSSAWSLNWYQDHSGATLPRPWVVSAPLWVYRLLMLGWALWLAYSLLDWLRWGWGCYAANGLWRPRKKKTKPESGKSGPETPVQPPAKPW